jgi:hypothetical protein
LGKFLLTFELTDSIGWFRTAQDKWPSPRYEVKVVFRAPVPYVFGWWTDYTPRDARLEGEDYARKIIRRSSREVVYEDLDESKEGWFWARHVVRLSPPTRWHSDSVGSHREYSLDYGLVPLPGDRTELTLRARRRPAGIWGKNPPKRQWEGSVGTNWKRFARALERDYKRSLRA